VVVVVVVVLVRTLEKKVFELKDSAPLVS